MITNPDRLGHIFMTGFDPEEGRIADRYCIGIPPANFYRGYIEVAQPTTQLKGKAELLNSLAARLGLEIYEVLRDSGAEPTDELLNDVAELVFERVEAEYQMQHPDYVIPQRPAFKIPVD